MPYYYRGALFLITDYCPNFRIIKISDSSGRLVLKDYYSSRDSLPSWNYGEIRGGTPLLSRPKAQNAYLYGFVHSHLENYKGYARYYFYTVIRFHPHTKQLEYYPKPLGESDAEIDNELIDLWKQSTGGQMKVVFPIGITHHADGVLVSFGIDDIRSELRFFKWDYLTSLF